MIDRWRHLEVADQWGRRAVVTGANTGLGFVSALALVNAGAEVVHAHLALEPRCGDLPLRHQHDPGVEHQHVHRFGLLDHAGSKIPNRRELGQVQVDHS